MSGHISRAWILRNSLPPERDRARRPSPEPSPEPLSAATTEPARRGPTAARPWTAALLLTGGAVVIALNVNTLWDNGRSVVLDGGDRRIAVVSALATGALCLLLAVAGIALALTRRSAATATTALALGATLTACATTLLTFFAPSGTGHVGPVAILLLSYGTSRLATTIADHSPARTSPVS